MKINLAGALAALMVIAGCSTTPPKPPTCDGTDRHPINTPPQTSANTSTPDTCSRG